MSNDFTYARLRLVALYLLIIAAVIILFSFLVIREADDSQQSVSSAHSFAVTAEEAEALARAMMPDRAVTDTEYEIEDGTLYFTVEFEGDIDVKRDLFTGAVRTDIEQDGIIAMLTDDFDEMVVWIGLAVFCLAALGSAYVAHRTFAPIHENIRKQKQFVSGAAHELRNPLAALHARIEAALRTPEHEQSRGVLEDLLAETTRLIALSEELLVLERDEERVRDTRLCSVKECVDAVALRLSPLMEKKHLTLDRAVLSEFARMDMRDLDTILYNLLHNAIKFSLPGSRIRLTWEKGVLTVSDEGSGIAEADLPHIFERFYKADAAGQGTGLGLALVAETARRYGGSVRVHSVPGKGATFSVSLPFAEDVQGGFRGSA